MKINPSIFRTYDIRGVYPDDLNEEAARLICQAFISRYPKAIKIVVARDTRKSSPALAGAIIKELANLGREVIDIGIAPDPLFYFSIFHYRFDGGIAVEGSHNPKEYNGIILHVRKPGWRLSKDVIEDELEKLKEMVIKKRNLAKSQGGGKITSFNPGNDYLKYVTARINLKRPLKIIFDTGNGAMGFLPERVFNKLGCRTKTLYGKFDGDFPRHLPDPYKEENIRDLQKAVVKERADLGFAYDGDGDRVVPIDNKGRAISGDYCLLLLAKQALQKKKGPVVHDMRVPKFFLDEMKKEKVKTYFSVSHHNAVIDKIIKTKAVFGGEITLHFLFPLDYYLCDDALFASLKLAEILSQYDDPASYVDSLPRAFTSPEIFIDTPDEEKFQIIKNLQHYLRKNKYDFIDVDGARINFPRGWALARAANTTPIIKCRFEGQTKEDLIAIEKESLGIFKKVGVPVTKKIYQELGLA